MKKFLLTITAIAGITFASQAQTEAGKTMIGGSIRFSTTSEKDSDEKENSFSIEPQIGYFVANNIAVGTRIGYGWSKDESGSGQETINNSFSVSPFGRIYQGGGPVKFFGQLSIPISWRKAKLNDDEVGTNSSYGVALSPGLAYFPTERIGIEFSVTGLYFNSTKHESDVFDNNWTRNDFGLNVNSQTPSIGVQFHF
ncbi:outer membrane beta-barrel protein [Sphingobacterium hungaricum]|uniref:Outer membrane protein beta-barrel domain-containing protein n=1 Tax=Sphingobacterium hungaricum TaxID=2082723 RepID=A0A928UYZ3_9SPHI|nr:outer membrane beta-barrel protein [Sphingobacterium hungaricum]MBE8715252.1 hypothetical protein [Sphingobacterium hungaricum]